MMTQGQSLTSINLSARLSVSLSVYVSLSISHQKKASIVSYWTTPLLLESNREAEGKGRPFSTGDLIIMSCEWLPAMSGFPKYGGDANKDGHCPKRQQDGPEAGTSWNWGGTERKCCVRIVTSRITETSLRKGEGGGKAAEGERNKQELEGQGYTSDTRKTSS